MIDPLVDYLSVSRERTPPNGRTKAPNRPLIRASDISELAAPVERLIGSYPVAAIATAFLAGVVMAWWIKRK